MSGEEEADFELKLIDKVTGSSKKISGSLDVIQKALGQTGKSAEESGGIMEHAWGEAIGGAIEKTVEKVIELGKEVAATVVEFANFAQKSQFALGQLAKFGADPAKLFQHTQDMAVDLGMDVENTTEKFTEFLKLQMNPTQADDLIKMGADLRSLGTSGEEINSVFTNMGQIFSKGKLGGDDLRSLEQAGISGKLIFAQLGKQLGKTSDEVQKLINNGKINADEAITAIQDAVMHKTGEKVLGEAGAKFADTTMEGMVGRMKAQGERLLTQVGSQLAPALTSALQPMADDLTKFFSGDEGKQFTQSLADGLVELAGVVKAAWPYVKQFVGGFVEGFEKAWPAIKGAIGVLFEGFGSGATWMETVKNLAVFLGEATATAIGLAAAIGSELGAAIRIGVAAITAITDGFNWIINGIGAVIFAVDDFVMNLGARWERLKTDALLAGGNLIQGLITGITNGVGAVVQAASNLGGAVMTSIKAKLGIASPSKVFEGYGAMTGLGFVQGIEGSMGQVTGAVDGLGDVAVTTGATAGRGPMVSSLSTPANSNATPGGGSKAFSVTFGDIYVNSPASDARGMANDIKHSLMSELGDAFEQFAAEVAA